jgi:hypothetical protein
MKRHLPHNPNPPPTWQATIRGRNYGEAVTAMTKSEARSELKNQIGLPSDGRLPIGVQVDKVN